MEAPGIFCRNLSPREPTREMMGTGGALENRMRFPLEVLRDVKAAVGIFP